MNENKCPTYGDHRRDCTCCLECGARYGDCECGNEDEAA